MKTSLDCIPCFFRQAIETARISGAGSVVQRRVLHELAEKLPAFSLKVPPPEIARTVYGIVKRATRIADPYLQMKKESNARALSMYPALQRSVSASDDPLRRAVGLAISGNIIDYGVTNALDIRKELHVILHPEQRFFGKGKTTFMHYRDFAAMVKNASNILYLGDNAGETVFDRILIEEIMRSDPNKKIIYAVRGFPIINDALIEDAYQSGLHRVATVISSGSDAPGTILPLCSKDFRRIYRTADMIISKGQGNFETLSDQKKPIFFMLRAKCAVVSEHIGCRIGDVLLLSNRRINQMKKAAS